jgi:hypothetical protein
MVTIAYTLMNEKSPEWDNLEHDISISFNVLDVNFNRLTVAAILRSVFVIVDEFTVHTSPIHSDAFIRSLG